MIEYAGMMVGRSAMLQAFVKEMTMIDMRVNDLPAQTYRWLKLNESTLQSEKTLNRFALAEAEHVPEGITVEYGVEAKKAEEIFASSHEMLLEKKKSRPEGPNGDTAPRHAAQIVRTGMGIEVDDLLESHHVPVTVITAEVGEKISEPLFIEEKLADGEGVLARQVIVAKENSELTVIMNYDSAQSDSGMEGISTKVYVEKGAVLHLIKVQMLGRDVDHFDDVGGVIMEDGHMDLLMMELGGSRVWNGCYINLLGKKASFHDETGYFRMDKQQYDINYVVEHNGRKSVSDMICRGVLKDEAQKTFRGTLDFHVGSCGSVGEEAEDVLLLSPGVINRTIPLILCEEEDVDGHHGASIGQLNDDMLFYMEARGIDKETARKIMTGARLRAISRQIPSTKIQGRIDCFIDKALS